MVIEKRHSITLDEIIAYEFRCKKPTCGTRITVIAAKGVDIPDRCPQCGYQWHESTAEAVAASNSLRQFLEAVPEMERLKQFLGCELYLLLRSPQESQDDVLNKKG